MINYTEKGIGLHDLIFASGHWLVQKDGVWESSDDEAVQAIIDSYDPTEALTLEAIAKIGELRLIADAAIAPLQDAADLGRLTDQKRELLIAWKGYRIDLTDIPEQSGYPHQIDWPSPPA